MSTSMYLTLLYCFIFIAFIMGFHLAKKYLTVRQKIAGKPTYPFIKAFSILLMAFIVQNGASQMIFPAVMEQMGLEVQAYPGNTTETIVFYLVVGAIAIAYAVSLKGQKQETK